MPQHQQVNHGQQLQSPSEEQQDRLLDESLSSIKVQSFHMKCCLDKGKLMEALKHASSMLSELRTSLLSPKSYYELYMAVTDQLRHLELYLVDEFQRDNKIFELYELVQYAGNIIPRLYLLISVGLVYMRTSPNCRKEVLRDLVEMCRGVQHPLRGLFLRNYLLQTCRHVLPDVLGAENGHTSTPANSTSANSSGFIDLNTTTSTPASAAPITDEDKSAEKNEDGMNEEPTLTTKPQPEQQTQFVGTNVGMHANGDPKAADLGTVMDSIDFVLVNFAEMNKLWVRMQHLGHTRDRERREKERLELRLLVGTNLVRLSQLESVDVSLYTRVVLPGILEQVVSCKDAIAQEYLMESLIQVFPDEFHLVTLSPFLNSCAELAADVKVKNIIIALVDRLAASHDVALPDDLFETFSRQISHIIASRPSISIEDIITMQGSLINFSLKKIGDEAERETAINSVLAATLKAIKEMNVLTINLRSALGKEMFRFLKLPFNLSASSLAASIDGSNIVGGGGQQGQTAEAGLIKRALKLTHYKELLKGAADIELHRQIVLTLLTATLDNYSEDAVRPSDRLSLPEIEVFLMELCAPLVNGSSCVVVGGDKTETSNVVVDAEDEDFIDEQLLLGRFLHFLLLPQCIEAGGEDEKVNGGSDEEEISSGLVVDTVQLLDTTYLTLNSARKILATGGPARIRYQFPVLVFEALQLALRYTRLKEADEKWEKKCQKIYQYVNQLIVALLKEGSCPELCLRLFLEAAQNAAQSGITDRESIAYEFISQAFAIYEEEISDSKEQTLCLLLIIATVKAVRFENAENFAPLRNQCCLNCGKLVKKSDQCRAILVAASLFVVEEESSKPTLEAEALKCFRKCIKISSSLLDSALQLQLYVEILSHLTLYVKYDNADVAELVRGLAAQIAERRAAEGGGGGGSLPEMMVSQLENTLAYLKKSGIEVAAA